MKFETFKKAFFRGAVNKNDLIQNIKTTVTNFKSLKKYIGRVESEIVAAKNLSANGILGKNPFPKKYGELNTGRSSFYSGSLIQELNWQAIAFLKCQNEINLFLKYKSLFEHSLLLGNYTDARKILNVIEQEVCISFWSIENRLILEEKELGTEKNWELRNTLLDIKNDGFVRIFGDMYSLKAEKRISFFQYNDLVNEWFVKNDLQNNPNRSGQLDYFRFKSNYFSSLKYEHLGHVIYYDCRASIIDRYLNFIRVIQHLLINGNEQEDFPLELLMELTKVIKDVALNQILLIKASNYEFDSLLAGDEILSIIDEYTHGNYENAIGQSKKYLLEKESFHLELVEVYVKSLIEKNLEFQSLGEESSILNNVAKLYFQILRKNADSDEAYIDLMKLAYIFSNSSIGIHLFSFINLDLGWVHSVEYSLLASLNSKFLNPKIASFIYKDAEIVGSVLKNLFRFKDHITSKLYKNFYENYIANCITVDFAYVPKVKSEIYKIRNLILMDKYQDSIHLYIGLLNVKSISTISEYEVRSSLFNCYMVAGDDRMAIILNVEVHLNNLHLTKKMDVNTLVARVIKNKFKNVGDLNTLIDLPIFFKINCTDKIKVKQTYQLFLTSCSCTKPSDLIELVSNFDLAKFIYFLSNVCIPEILQLSKTFDSTYAVNEERILICKFLAEFDSISEKLYKEEIAELTQKNTISKVIGGIDERKIFVNENKIRQNIRKVDKQNVLQNDQISPLTGESFERYLKLLDYVKNKKLYRSVESIMQFGDNGEINFIEAEENKVYNTGDVDAIIYLPALRIFISFFLYIRDLFIFSKEYGLDAYLSTRIRHGTLPNHLRSVFETYSLVTSQTDNVYSENAYWKERIDIPHIQKGLQDVLSNFSREVDSFSRDIKDKFIQCANERKHNNPEALLDFSYGQQQLVYLFLEDFDDVKNIDEFIDKCFSELWKRTETCLENIRTKINLEFKDRYVNLMDNLQSEILNLTDRFSVSELINSIMTCKTEMQNKLNNISKWFRRSESSYDGEYDLLILVETSIQITKNIHPNYHFDMVYDVCSNFNIRGEYHQHFIDLMNNFLFNIIKHSDLQNSDLNANLIISEKDNFLKLEFSNCVYAVNDHLMKLQDIKNNWAYPDINVSQEGGTGFPKIKRIISSDLNRSDSTFEFEISENKLTIAISFETKDLKI